VQDGHTALEVSQQVESAMALQREVARFTWSPLNHNSFGRSFRDAVRLLFQIAVVPTSLLARLPLEMLYSIVEQLAAEVRRAHGRWRDAAQLALASKHHRVRHRRAAAAPVHDTRTMPRAHDDDEHEANEQEELFDDEQGFAELADNETEKEERFFLKQQRRRRQQQQQQQQGRSVQRNRSTTDSEALTDTDTDTDDHSGDSSDEQRTVSAAPQPGGDTTAVLTLPATTATPAESLALRPARSEALWRWIAAPVWAIFGADAARPWRASTTTAALSAAAVIAVVALVGSAVWYRRAR